MTNKDLECLHTETGVSAVLSLQHDDCLAYWNIDYAKMRHTGTELGLLMDRCPIRDFDIPDMRRQLPAAISRLAHRLDTGHRVYLHCTAGLGRSPLVALGYLTLVGNHTPEQAIQQILTARPGAVPSWEAYYGCCEDLAALHRQSIEHRAYQLYQLGAHQHADADWYQAQAEILRSNLLRQ